jgi:hypothetical protein
VVANAGDAQTKIVATAMTMFAAANPPVGGSILRFRLGQAFPAVRIPKRLSPLAMESSKDRFD